MPVLPARPLDTVAGEWLGVDGSEDGGSVCHRR